MAAAASMGLALALDDAARFAAATLHRAPGAVPRSDGIRGASIDSRAIAPGQLFVPLAGTHVDGHRFVAQAFTRGAAAALCERAHYPEFAGCEPGPLLVVDDVTIGLQAIARGWRARWTGDLIAVTGSAGKTTTKNLVAAVLGTRGPTLRTSGNLNNHWGVPLTLMELGSAHRAAVVEMGMNHEGEIAVLAALAAPTAAVITNVGSAHLEHFGTIEAIAREKASLAHALPHSGVVFAGADSPALLDALAGAPCRIVTYGFDSIADVWPRAYESLGPAGSRFEVEGFPPVRLPLVGRHQVMNALAALAVAREFRCDPADAVAALERVSPDSGRMELRTVRGAMLLVDCYNANPESTRAALETLAAWPDATRRIAVLGDMLELGPAARELHHAAGTAVRHAELWSVGVFAADYAAGAMETPKAGVTARTFDTKLELARDLFGQLAPGVVVLLKGSRGAALEDVLSELERLERGEG